MRENELYLETPMKIIHDQPAPIPLKILYKIRRAAAHLSRGRRNARIRETLGNIEFSIFANNCLGGVFYHDAGRKFTTPTVNLSFEGPDFIKFLERPQYYLEQELRFIKPDVHGSPVGMLDDIRIFFVHYKTEADAENAWNRRKERIVWDNLFVVSTDHDGMYLPEMMKRFDKLPYRKVMFTAKKLPQYEWAVWVPQFKKRNNVRIMTAFANLRGQRYYETCFDLAQWIRNHSTDECRADS